MSCLTKEVDFETQMSGYNTLFKHSLSYLVSQSIYVVAKLNIADYLSDGPKHIDDIADKTKADKGYLSRIMRLLATNEIFDEVENDVFSVNFVSECLKSNSQNTLKDFAIMMNFVPAPFTAITKLFDCVKSGNVPFEDYFGVRSFDMLAREPELALQMDKSMSSVHKMATKLFVDKYDLTGTNVFADIGGGSGEATIGVLEEYLDIQGIVFDREHVVERTRKIFESNGLINRCKMVGGSFFKEIPVHADVYFLRQVLHDWTDDECITILKNLRASAKIGAKLLVSDCIINKKQIQDNTPYYDMLMLVILGGKERTLDEFKRIFSATGFEFSRVVKTGFWFDVIEAYAI